MFLKNLRLWGGLFEGQKGRSPDPDHFLRTPVYNANAAAQKSKAVACSSEDFPDLFGNVGHQPLVADECQAAVAVAEVDFDGAIEFTGYAPGDSGDNLLVGLFQPQRQFPVHIFPLPAWVQGRALQLSEKRLCNRSMQKANQPSPEVFLCTFFIYFNSFLRFFKNRPPEVTPSAVKLSARSCERGHFFAMPVMGPGGGFHRIRLLPCQPTTMRLD
jgi:hypothetical protein